MLNEAGNARPLALTPEERSALMACYVLGRQHGLVPRVGGLGRLAEKLAPQGSLLALGDAMYAARQGRLAEAANRIKGVQVRGPKAATERHKAAATLEALSEISRRKP